MVAILCGAVSTPLLATAVVKFRRRALAKARIRRRLGQIALRAQTLKLGGGGIFELA